MTDRLTTVEVEELIGQATDPPVAPAGSTRQYYNSTADEVRESINGSPYVRTQNIGGADWIPEPVQAQKTRSGNTIFTDFRFGMFRCPEPIRPTRCIVFMSTFNNAGTLVLAVYQPTDGQSGVCDLLSTGTIAFGATGTLDVTMSAFTLQKGIYYLAWGLQAAAANNQLVCYAAATIEPINFPYSSIPNGLLPADAESSVLASAPPATLDLRVGAGVSIESGGALCVAHRWAT